MVRRYLFSYSFNGEQYCFDIPASSIQEAERRLGAMQWATYDGELHDEIAVYLGSKIAVRRYIQPEISRMVDQCGDCPDEFVEAIDYDRLATLARSLCGYLNAHSEQHQLQVEQLLQVKAILHELGED